MPIIETGLLGRQQTGVICVVFPRKRYMVMELIQSVNPDAFITITKIKEVWGRGLRWRDICKQKERSL